MLNKLLCKLGLHKPCEIFNDMVVCLNCLKDIKKVGNKWVVPESYMDKRNKQLNEYYDKVKYAFSDEVYDNDDDDFEPYELDSIFSFRDDSKYDHLSEYERELFEKIFLIHFLEDLEKAKIIRILK